MFVSGMLSSSYLRARELHARDGIRMKRRGIQDADDLEGGVMGLRLGKSWWAPVLLLYRSLVVSSRWQFRLRPLGALLFRALAAIHQSVREYYT